MKVVNLCTDDWANFSYDNCQAMRSVGIDASSYKLNHHVSNYGKESEVCTIDKMIAEIKDAEYIQIVHNNVKLFYQILPHVTNQKLIVVYTGTDYRVNHEILNEAFNPHVYKSVIALGEFAGLGAKKEVYMVGAIDIGAYHPAYEVNRPYKITHYPSNPDVKGTADIEKMMSLMGNNGYVFICSKERLYFKEHINRLSLCDIYIELFARLNNGKKYGSWGITTLEAAALGKAVITMNLSSNIYDKAYGYSPLVLIEDEEDFKKAISMLTLLTPLELKDLKQRTRQWVEEKHSYKATGEYILRHILNEL